MIRLSSSALRRLILLDAVGAALMGCAHLLAAAELAALMGLPVGLLEVSGAVLLLAGGYALWLGRRSVLPTAGVRLLAVGNFSWVLASVWLAFGMNVALSLAGLVWVLAQAAVTLVMAELEWFAA